MLAAAYPGPALEAPPGPALASGTDWMVCRFVYSA